MHVSPDSDEAAAIAAAIARFEADTAPVEAAVDGSVSPWQRAALVEGISAKGTVQRHLESKGGFEWLS